MKLVSVLGGFLIILLACGAETPNVTPVGTIAPTPTPTPRVIVVTAAPTATPMPPSTPVPTMMPTPTPTATPEPTATAAPAATPTPTPTATPTPPPLGSRQNPVRFGTEVDVKNALNDHWRIAVIDTVPDATRLVLGENPFFNNPPKEGFRFYIVTIRVQYLGPDSTSFGGSYRLKALGVGGVVYTTFADSCWVIPDDLPDPELFTNGTVEGNVCWEVADDDVDSLQMFLDSGLFSGLLPGLLPDTPRTWFALQNKTPN